MDKQPQWRIFINTLPGHNKFWKVARDPADPATMLVHNGRLGAKGQLQPPKRHINEYACRAVIDVKLCEKRYKGYKEVKQPEFELKSMEAAIVGSMNKCTNMCWVRCIESDREIYAYDKVTDAMLADPNYDPVLLVELDTKKEYAGKAKFTLLFTPDYVALLRTITLDDLLERRGTSPLIRFSGTQELITNNHPLYELVTKLKLAIGLHFK